MKRNRTVAYGLACLQYLSTRGTGWTETRQIAKAQELPEPYCNKVLQSMAHAGLVVSSRGRGFKLGRPLNAITAWEVLEALTINGAPASPGEAKSLALYECLWERVNHMLAGLTLDEVVAGAEVLSADQSR